MTAQIVPIVGELHLGTVAGWEAQVESVVSRSSSVVIDLTRLEFIDSAGVHGLFKMLAAADAAGSQVALVCPSDRPARRLLETLSLDSVVVLYETVDLAKEAAQNTGSSPTDSSARLT